MLFIEIERFRTAALEAASSPLERGKKNCSPINHTTNSYV